jgi:hypothetical protein
MRRAVVADIGSNDTEFWFMNPDEKSIYTCKFEDLPSTPLAISFQPDWIIDALGLKTISPEVARAIKVRRGKDPATTELVFPPTRSNGQVSRRVLTVSNQSRQIKTHRLYSGDTMTLLAQADITEYQNAPLDDSDGQSAEPGPTCLLPQTIRLDWKQEQFTLDVNLKDVVLNNFDPRERAAVFVEPTPEGYAHVDLANTRPSRGPGGETTIRESLPAPESKANRRVRLGSPVADPDDSASTDEPIGDLASRGPGRSATELDEDVETAPLEEPLRARIPRAPDPYNYQLADSARRDAPPPAVGKVR